ncbi:MAG: hypothetical protein A2538_03960 [Candidatus Magasanikbacteria bacterium RIFOXYD2_FULL_41_14]|uniref:tRNA dimethylallyltransferase n=1 Tax=Candidatus Magasanikbacteria bacterium RIFOXYD2_FULL_41_14 TaxID=1798709 RepID=A0A1F6PCB8_9BACT|nr:MAG: hypothetical protein A2538_03960 [Candidatus Magasanikbacteria bacterium RIFOXYD2_FULL_41_14]
MFKLPKIIAILGPTASGKTDVGIFLAKKFNGEVVSFDSRQIYIGMDIGTAKPRRDGTPSAHSSKEGDSELTRQRSLPVSSTGQAIAQVDGDNHPLAPSLKMRGEYVVDGVRHHLVDFIDPDQDYSLADFKQDAVRAIADILGRGKLPILVGGTGLYFWAVIDNLEIPKVVPDKKLRNELEKLSLSELVKMLRAKDPESARVVDLENPRRVLRALEVALSGESFVKQQKKGKPLYDVLQIGLNWEREELNERINKRVDRQMEAGLVAETEGLARDPTLALPFLKREGKCEVWALPSMSGIGYRQMGYFLRGEMSLPEAVEILKRDTRHYAKRQMTWFKRNQRIKWIERDDKKAVGELVEKFIE